MKTVTLQVATRQDVNRRTLEAFRGKKQGSRISFETPELLFRLMTAKRWALIRTITGAGPLTIREIARRVHRDVKAVHGDVHALLNCGVLQRNDSLIVFPYDAVRVDFVLRAAQLNSLIRRVFEAAGIDFTGGLVLQVVEDLRRTYDIANMTVELLGMAFKAEIEDTRASLSYKLKRTLQMSAREGHSSANALRRERIAIFEVAEY